MASGESSRRRAIPDIRKRRLSFGSLLPRLGSGGLLVCRRGAENLKILPGSLTIPLTRPLTRGSSPINAHPGLEPGVCLSLAAVQVFSVNDRNAKAGIGLVSAAIFSFLLWLLYLRPDAAGASDRLAWVPAANASFNAACTACLLLGLVAIRRGARALHVCCMLCALLFSACFLVGYVVYHFDHGDTHFAGQGAVRPAYFLLLISHVVLTAAALPMILTTLYYAAGRRFSDHRRIARRTLPLWLYVSVSGILVFAALRAWA